MSENTETQEFSSEINDGSDQEGENQQQTAQNLTPQEVKKKLNSLKIKFNGKEVEEKLPFEIDEEHADYMRRQIQMAKLAQTKSQESAALERDIINFIQELKTNPRKALSN